MIHQSEMKKTMKSGQWRHLEKKMIRFVAGFASVFDVEHKVLAATIKQNVVDRFYPEVQFEYFSKCLLTLLLK